MEPGSPSTSSSIFMAHAHDVRLRIKNAGNQAHQYLKRLLLLLPSSGSEDRLVTDLWRRHVLLVALSEYPFVNLPY
jgi:hypothetical protein